MLTEREKQILAISSLSRIVIILFSLIVSCFVSKYDTSSDIAFPSPLNPFASWDGIYFLTIATKGYMYEQFHAFFPAFPFLIHLGHKYGL